MLGKSVVTGGKKVQTAEKKSRKRSGFVIVSYILKTVHLQQLKEGSKVLN